MGRKTAARPFCPLRTILKSKDGSLSNKFDYKRLTLYRVYY